jgi:hypothetical protein
LLKNINGIELTDTTAQLVYFELLKKRQSSFNFLLFNLVATHARNMSDWYGYGIRKDTLSPAA